MPEAKVGEIRIYYEEHGQGTPLMMILGLGQDLAAWGLQISHLSDHFRLILFYNRDAGRSSRCSGNYTTKTMARDVLALMDHLEIERAHLLGTSMGGMIAQEVAFSAPDRVISLILASTTSSGEG